VAPVPTYEVADLTRDFRTKITVCPSCDCWLFSRTDRSGYSQFKFRSKNLVGHRFAYSRLVGPVPDGYDLDHMNCTLHRCVHPAHLEPVPRTVNAERANETRWRGTKVDGDGLAVTAASCPLCLLFDAGFRGD